MAYAHGRPPPPWPALQLLHIMQRGQWTQEAPDRMRKAEVKPVKKLSPRAEGLVFPSLAPRPAPIALDRVYLILP